MRDLTPRQIVTELDRYIVGQHAAKRSMAVSLRNRYRRQQLSEDMRREVVPKNLLLIGPTGVGKTEIARRVSKLTDAPFVKVEATKFTEVGYVGRDVESIVRDLVENSVNIVHGEKMAAVYERAQIAATEKLINYLVRQSPKGKELFESLEVGEEEKAAQVNATQRVSVERRLKRQRKRVAEMLSQSRLDNEIVEIEVEVSEEAFGPMDELLAEFDLEEFSEGPHHGQPPQRRSRKVSVADARRILIQQESQKLIDFDSVIDDAVRKAEQNGVVFIDEIDKIITGNTESGGEVSGEGVQRDLLPIVEGSTVSTRYGPVNTDHILFIAAGAFLDHKPSDLIPELQGRFPLRVELNSLSAQDLELVLTEPDNSLIKQYKVLLATEGIELEFTPDGVREVARSAYEMNEKLEDIGARRLQTVMEQVLEEVSFDATELEDKRVIIDAEYVKMRMSGFVRNEDLGRFIL